MKNLVFFFTGEKENDDRKFTSVIIIVLLSGYCFDIFPKYILFINSKNCNNFPLINPDWANICADSESTGLGRLLVLIDANKKNYYGAWVTV